MVLPRVLLGVLFLLLAMANGARADLVTNGNFASFTSYMLPGGGAAPGFEIGPNSGTSTYLTGWTSYGANALFTSNSNCATCLGNYSPQFGSYMKLWAADNVPVGTVNTWNGLGPGGMNYVAADGAWQSGALTQTINGLTVGRQYQVTFQSAGAQEKGYTAAFKTGWTVALGNQSFSTVQTSSAGRGFSDWASQSFTYTATASSMLLSFIASAPTGSPPYSLLANVGMTQVPEPATLALVGVGVAGIALLRRRRRRR